MPNRRIVSFRIIPCLTLVLGCAHSTEPRTLGSVDLLPETYTFGPCEAAWLPNPPAVRRTIIDFHFASEGTGPSPAQIAAIEHAGGVVLYTFHIPVVRAAIDVSAVPAVVNHFSYAITVPDSSRHDVQLIVLLAHAVTDADIAAVEGLGGRVIDRYTVISGYAVRIDDAAVPRLRALSGVEDVSADGVGCVA